MSVLFSAAAFFVLTASDPAGQYALSGVREMVSGIDLKPDHTYEFGLTYGAADFWSEGSWKLEKGKVVLTAKADEGKAFRLIRSARAPAAGKLDAIRIRVVAANGGPVPNIDVICGSAKERTDSEGVAYFRPEQQPLASCKFQIRVYQFESEAFELNREHVDHTFEINGRAITMIRFDNETMTRTSEDESLELRFFDPARPLLYRRVSK